MNKKLKKLLERLDVTLTAEEIKFQKKLTRYYKSLQKQYLDQAQQSVNKLLNKIGGPLNKTDFNQLNKIIQDYYKQMSAISIKEANKEMRIMSGVNGDLLIPDVDLGLKRRAEVLADMHLKEFNKQVQSHVKAAIGTKADQLIVSKAIRKATKVFVRRHVKITSRMESVSTVNQARLAAGNASKIVVGWQFIAIIDKMTTQICRDRHLHYIPIHSDLLTMYTPPCHYGCRSILSPVTIFDSEFKKAKYQFTDRKTALSVPPKDFGKKNNEKFKPITPKVLSAKELENRVQDVESRLLLLTGNKREAAAVIDKYGQVQLMKMGNKNSVKFLKSESSLFNGNVLTHNHPNSSSLSPADLLLAMDWKVKQVRAVAKDSELIGRKQHLVYYADNFPPYKPEFEKSIPEDFDSLLNLSTDIMSKSPEVLKYSDTKRWQILLEMVNSQLAGDYKFNYGYIKK